ncbi:MAG: hypothetical protein AB1810_10805, partial [Pseudomonadota bacterium]
PSFRWWSFYKSCEGDKKSPYNYYADNYLIKIHGLLQASYAANSVLERIYTYAHISKHADKIAIFAD